MHRTYNFPQYDIFSNRTVKPVKVKLNCSVFLEGIQILIELRISEDSESTPHEFRHEYVGGINNSGPLPRRECCQKLYLLSLKPTSVHQ